MRTWGCMCTTGWPSVRAVAIGSFLQPCAHGHVPSRLLRTLRASCTPPRTYASTAAQLRLETVPPVQVWSEDEVYTPYMAYGINQANPHPTPVIRKTQSSMHLGWFTFSIEKGKVSGLCDRTLLNFTSLSAQMLKGKDRMVCIYGCTQLYTDSGIGEHSSCIKDHVSTP